MVMYHSREPSASVAAVSALLHTRVTMPRVAGIRLRTSATSELGTGSIRGTAVVCSAGTYDRVIYEFVSSAPVTKGLVCFRRNHTSC